MGLCKMRFGRVLVTGGAGFIGSHLVDTLVESSVKPTVLDDLSTGRMKNLANNLKNQRINFVEGDIRTKSTADCVLDQREVVFHLAAITSVPFSVEHPEVTHEVNVDGTRNLLEVCLRRGVERFVYVSTSAVYGDPKYLPIDEEHPLDPISPYAESKLKAERLCIEFQEVYGLEVTILRPFNVYGPRQRNDQYAGVIAKFIERLRGGQPPVIYGDGLQTRDFIYVTDAVRALLLASESDDAVGKIFNVATGVSTTILELAQLLMEMLGADGVRPELASGRQGDIRHSYADIGRARSRLGFEPQVALKEGLSKLLGSHKYA